MPETHLANYWNYILTGTEHGGPFNVVSKTRPKNTRDANFWDHDQEYTAYQEAGLNPYIYWNQADQELLSKLQWNIPADQIALSYFEAKKKAAPNMGDRKRLRTQSMFELANDITFVPPAAAAAAEAAGADNAPDVMDIDQPGEHGANLATIANGERPGLKPARCLSDMRRGHGSIRLKRINSAIDPQQFFDSQCPVLTWRRYDHHKHNGANQNMLALVGQQGVHTWDSTNTPNFFTMAPISDIRSIANKYNRDVAPISQGLSDAISGLIDGSSGTNNRVNNLPPFLCLGYERTYAFMNTHSYNCTLEVWEVTSKFRQDLDKHPVQSWSEDLTYSTAVGSGTYGLKAALSNVAPKGTDAAPVLDYTKVQTDPGLRPGGKNGKNFSKDWHVRRKTLYVIPAGKNIHHTVNLKGFAMSHHELYDGFQDEQEMIPGISVELMCFLQGEKCFDETDNVQPMSITPASLICEFKEVHTWRSIPKWRTHMAWTTHRDHAKDPNTGLNRLFTEAAAPKVIVSQAQLAAEQQDINHENLAANQGAEKDDEL